MKENNIQRENERIHIPYDNIFKKEDGIYVISKNKDNKEIERKIARSVGISKININIDDGTRKSYVYFDNMIGITEMEIQRDEYLNNKNLIKYQKYGMDIMGDTSYIIANHLRNEEEIAPKVFTHTNIGFSTYNEDIIYKLNSSIGIDSLYCGNLEIQPKGSRDIWISMFKDEVLGNPYLEFITVCSLSSILIGYIGEELTLDNIIVHIFGNSSTGKSTAVKLAISLFGYPDVKKNGLFSTFNATENALIRKLAGLKGVPFAFDELSMGNLTDTSSLIYKLANGTDKSRLNKNLEEEKNSAWNTLIFTNGEKSLIKSANKNAGIQLRVIEIGNIKWTKDATNADRINRTIIENYGHIGLEFAEFVMKIGKEKIIEQYNKTVIYLNKFLESKCVSDDFTSRRVNKFAVIMTTLTLFKKMLNIEISNKNILDILLEIEKDSIKERNFNRSAIDYIKQYISVNGSKFEYFDKQIQSRDYLGKLNKIDDYTELVITPIALDKILKEGGFEDKQVVLKELKKSGHLNCEADRYTRKRQLEKGITTTVHVIKIPN